MRLSITVQMHAISNSIMNSLPPTHTLPLWGIPQIIIMQLEHPQVTYQVTYDDTMRSRHTQAAVPFYYEFQRLDNKLI
jgi:hypothetical protein